VVDTKILFYILVKNKKIMPNDLNSLNRYFENDFYFACGILEGLPIKFSWLEIFQEKYIDKKMKLII
jgi:hypothetical protein